jgi:hypothetical protein
VAVELTFTSTGAARESTSLSAITQPAMNVAAQHHDAFVSRKPIQGPHAV